MSSSANVNATKTDFALLGGAAVAGAAAMYLAQRAFGVDAAAPNDVVCSSAGSNDVEVGGMIVKAPLYRVVDEEVCPGSGLSTEEFFAALCSLVKEMSAENASLLKKRAEMQAKIDECKYGPDDVNRLTPVGGFDCTSVPTHLRFSRLDKLTRYFCCTVPHSSQIMMLNALFQTHLSVPAWPNTALF